MRRLYVDMAYVKDKLTTLFFSIKSLLSACVIGCEERVEKNFNGLRVPRSA